VDDAVIFSGEIDDIPALIAALDLVLVPSWEEPFGRVVIEAMAMGTPVLATDVGGPVDIVSDGVDGLLLPPRRADLWAACVTQLLEHPERMATMGRAARAVVTRRYALPLFTRSVVDSYELALSGTALP